MTTEQIVGIAVLAALAVGLAVVGVLGRRGSIEYSLGGWRREQADPESWTSAHRIIGGGFVVAGSVAACGSVAVLAAPADVTGPLVVITAVVLLVPVVVGIARGTSRLEPA